MELSPHIEAEDKIIKVPAQPQPTRQGDLLVEAVPLEVSLRLILIGTYRPDIPCVSEEGELERAKDLHTVLGIHLKLDIPDLIEDGLAC